jgi:Ca2+-transporting ATPase
MVTAFSGSKIPTSGITAVQLLWVNLIMDTLAALALATDPPTPDLLNRKPAKRNEPILSPTMIKMIVGQGLYQIAVCLTMYFKAKDWHGDPNMTEADSLTLISALLFNTFVFCQLFNEFNCRSITNGKKQNLFFLLKKINFNSLLDRH